VKLGLKIKLVDDGKVIFEFPLDIREWKPEALQHELEDIETGMSNLLEIHDILSNETRMRMLCEMVKSLDCRFGELMENLDANQKTISSSLQRMLQIKLATRIERHPREVHYAPSQIGFTCLLTCAMMRRMMIEVKKLGGELLE